MVPIEMSTPHSYSTSIHTIGLSCISWLQHTTWQTTDNAIGIGCLCYSISGPKMTERTEFYQQFAVAFALIRRQRQNAGDVVVFGRLFLLKKLQKEQQNNTRDAQASLGHSSTTTVTHRLPSSVMLCTEIKSG